MESTQVTVSSDLEHSTEHASRASQDITQQPDEIQADHHPLPIFLKFEGVACRVVSVAAFPPTRQLKTVLSKVAWPWRVNLMKDSHKQILWGITGSIGPGEILALMGPSGSGKTTLLNIIGGRMSEKNVEVEGIITYNDIPYTAALKRRIGFVAQDDVLFPHLTVEETMVFAAFLRLPRNMRREQKHNRVERIIQELGLERCRCTTIGGGAGRGISGGERKRTSIGYEILVAPSLLLLDEPTSGLDSTSANKLLQILQQLAQAGLTILTTIHQPSSRMFGLFDKLLLISEGHPIYFGTAKDSAEYFAYLRFRPKITMNPAEFLLDLAAGEVNDLVVPSDLLQPPGTTISDTVIRYLQLKYRAVLESREVEDNHRGQFVPEHLQLAIQVRKEDWTVGWWQQVMVLSKRTYRGRSREHFDKLRIVQAIGVAVLLGLLWWNSKIDTESQLRDQVGLLYYICIFWASSSIFGSMYVFPFEKTYLAKERKADMYRLSMYYLCSTLCDLVIHVLYPTMFTIIVYFMAGFKRKISSFLFTLSATLLISITGHGVGELFGAASMNITRVGMLASLILMLFLLTGGYYVQHIPKFIGWLKHLSFTYYGFRLLLKVQYDGDELYECQSKEGCQPLQKSPTFDTVDLNSGVSDLTKKSATTISKAIIYERKEKSVIATYNRHHRSVIHPEWNIPFDILINQWLCRHLQEKHRAARVCHFFAGRVQSGNNNHEADSSAL